MGWFTHQPFLCYARIRKKALFLGLLLLHSFEKVDG